MPAGVLEAVARGLRGADVGRGETVVAAVSGGLDSVAMLHVLVELGQPVVVATVDHGLRPSSTADAGWVLALADALGVEAERRAVVVAPGNVQAQARRARYAALADVARRRGARFVAAAHTATDQAETVLLAMTRGAGLRGLAGMAPVRALEDGVSLVRPLLDVSRSQFESLARRRGWTWREDPSNASDAYRRNRLRRTALPALRAEGGEGTDVRIAASAAAARAALGVVRQGFDDAFDGAVLRVPKTGPRAAVWIADAAAAVSPETVRSRAWVERVEALLQAEVGRRVESGGLVVWREPGGLRFERPGRPGGLEGALVVEPLGAVPTAFGADPLVEVVDADRCPAPAVRPWRDGDRVRPLGLGGSQLVSDLLRDRGVPRALRRSVPVVTVGGEVAWVVGHRLGQPAAVSPSTTRAARWTWRPDAG